MVLPSDFTGCHQNLWAEMMSLASRGVLDLRGLIEALRSKKELNTIASFETDAVGEAYLQELLTYRGSDVRHYADQVLAHSGKRQLGMIAALIRAEADDRHLSYDEALSKAEERIFSLRHSKANAEGVPISTLLNLFEQRSQHMRAGRVEVWEPDLVALRRVVGFIDDDDFVVVAARPGMGKSSLLRWELARSAMDGYPSDIYNLENGPLEYAKWLIAMTTRIDSDLLRDARKLSDEQIRQVLEASKALANLPLYIITLGSPKVSEIISIASSRITREGIRRMAVDYLQLVHNGNENRVQDVSLTSNGLRGIALRYHIPVIAASQMSREIARRGEDAEPQLTDLRDSGSIEQDSTMVIFPVSVWRNPTEREMMRFPENVENGSLRTQIKAVPLRMKVAKNRNGGTGKSEPVLWVKSTNEFRTLVEV
jgi:replicative DNA helicase